jgi:hypothetical protein
MAGYQESIYFVTHGLNGINSRTSTDIHGRTFTDRLQLTDFNSQTSRLVVLLTLRLFPLISPLFSRKMSDTNFPTSAAVDPMTAAELHSIAAVEAEHQRRKKENKEDAYEFEAPSPPNAPPNTVSPTGVYPYSTTADVVVAATNVKTAASMVERARRFEICRLHPKATKGTRIPQPILILPPLPDNTSPTAASLFLQYRAVRRFCTSILRSWEPDKPIELPTVVANRPDDDLTDDEILAALHKINETDFLDSVGTRIEESLELSRARNERRCKMAAAYEIWKSHESREDKRSRRKLFEACPNHLEMPSDTTLRAAIRFRMIAQETPGNVWRYLPLTDNALGAGLEANWVLAIKEYGRMAREDANKA